MSQSVSSDNWEMHLSIDWHHSLTARPVAPSFLTYSFAYFSYRGGVREVQKNPSIEGTSDAREVVGEEVKQRVYCAGLIGSQTMKQPGALFSSVASLTALT